MRSTCKWFLIMCAPLLFGLFLGWDYTYITTTPAGTDDPREADDRMREIKAAAQERVNVDHYWTASAANTYDAADTGKHRQVTYQAVLAADPTVASGEAQTYTKTVSGQEEYFWRDDTNAGLQLTSAGEILFSSLGSVANNTYITAVDAAGTGTVNLIKADANDVAVVPDNSQTATNAAPISTTGIANKKYVDDQIAAILTYDGTELFNGTSPTSFTDLDIATLASLTAQRMMVFLSVTTTTAGDRNFQFRPNGETAGMSNNTSTGTASVVSLGQDEKGYIYMMTDASGVIEWKCNSGSTNGTIVLLTWQKVN